MLNPNPSSCSSNLIFLFSCLHSGILSLFEHVMSSLSKERPKDSKLSKTCQWFDPTHFNWTNFWELSTWIENFPPRKIQRRHQRRMINYMFDRPLASWEERMPNIQAFGGWVWNPNKMFNGNFTQNSTLSDTVWDGNQKNTKKKIHRLTNKAIKPIFDVGSFLIGAWSLRTFFEKQVVIDLIWVFP